MHKYFKFILTLIIPVIFMTGCAGMKEERKILKKTDQSVVHKSVIISPGRIYEECIELLPIHTMDYSFKASKPVKFNIHYHTTDKVFYPVLKENTAELSGTLNVVEQHYYNNDQEHFCLMWSNPHTESVKLTFDCRISVE